MCARRFLIFVFIMILLVVAGAFAIFQWGGNVLLRQATPAGHFEVAKAGDAPDYTKPESWLARPDVSEDVTDWLPQRFASGSDRPANAAVFYVHPTTYLRTDRWNAALDPAGDTEPRTQLMVRSQASAFTSAGEIWAPRYRQAAFGAFLLKSEDAQKALNLAYRDVDAAFRTFLSKASEGQPIILAGHSQGALHVLRLLQNHRAELKDRLVAAYIVGWPVDARADLPATGLPACTRPDQAGCLLSWQSFGEPANPKLLLDAWEETKGPSGIEHDRANMICVNPITGTQGGNAASDEGTGMLMPTADLTDARLAPGVGARCEKGLLIIGQSPELSRFVLPGNNYHAYDLALFWGATRRDAERRLQAWQKR
jgi:hypothetical protein